MLATEPDFVCVFHFHPGRRLASFWSCLLKCSSNAGRIAVTYCLRKPVFALHGVVQMVSQKIGGVFVTVCRANPLRDFVAPVFPCRMYLWHTTAQRSNHAEPKTKCCCFPSLLWKFQWPRLSQHQDCKGKGAGFHRKVNRKL